MPSPQPDLTSPDAIADWADTQSHQRIPLPNQPVLDTGVVKRPHYKRVSLRQEAKIYRLALEGHTQVQIAQLLGVNQSSVSRILSDWGDTKQAAQDYLASKALDVAARAVTESDPLDLLERIDVVKGKGGDKSGSGLTIQIGIAMPDLSPAPIDLRPALSPAKPDAE